MDSKKIREKDGRLYSKLKVERVQGNQHTHYSRWYRTYKIPDDQL